MTNSIKFSSMNAYRAIAGAYRIWGGIKDGKLVLDDELNLTNVSLCDEEWDKASEMIVHSNEVWAAPSAADPIATQKQVDLLQELSKFIFVNGIDSSAVTQSQASRMIDCAIEVRDHGY